MYRLAPPWRGRGSSVVGIELARAGGRWGFTVLALSVAGRVHIPTIATFCEASLRIFLRLPEPIPRRVPLSALAWFFLSVFGLPLQDRVGRHPASSREHDFPRPGFRGCSYFVMFRPPNLFASQIVPTAATFAAGQPRLLRPSRTCVVTFARIGYAIRLLRPEGRCNDCLKKGATCQTCCPISTTLEGRAVR